MKRHRRGRTTTRAFDPVLDWPVERPVQPSKTSTVETPNSFQADPPTAPATGAVKTAKRTYTKHRFHATKGAMKRQGIGAFDGRSSQARTAKSNREMLIERQGGEERLTPRERVLIDDAVQDMAVVGHANEFLRVNGDEIVNKNEKQFVPLVLERQRVASHLAETLKELESLRPTPKSMTVEEAEQSLKQIFGDELGTALVETAAEGFSPAAMNAIERGDLEGFVAQLQEDVTH